MYYDILSLGLNFQRKWHRGGRSFSALRAAPRTEVRGGSRCDSQIGRGPPICQVLPGCIITHSETSRTMHVADLPWALEGCELRQITMDYDRLP